MTDLLEGKTIALSISDSPELASLGLGPQHVQEAVYEFTRMLLLQGGRVAYGGDLRPGGFTDSLIELAEQLERPLDVYLAWPLYNKMAGIQPGPSMPSPAPDDLRARERRLRKIVTFHKLPESTGTQAPTDFLRPSTLDARAIWAHNLTAMRTKMADDCDARIILGGQITGWAGLVPGVVEEAVLTIDVGKPLYVVGAYGGAALRVLQALEGKEPAELTTAFHDHWLKGLSAFAPSVKGRMSIEGLGERLRAVGLAGLRNGIDLEQNRRLGTTLHVTEMLALVLAGLSGGGATP
jgi:hypothetical protein